MQSENETRGAQRIAAFRAAPQRETLCPQIYALVKKKPRTYTHTGVCVRVTRDFFSAIKWCAAYISLLYFYRFFLHICARRARSSESAEMRMMKKKKKTWRFRARSILCNLKDYAKNIISRPAMNKYVPCKFSISFCSHLAFDGTVRDTTGEKSF